LSGRDEIADSTPIARRVGYRRDCRGNESRRIHDFLPIVPAAGIALSSPAELFVRLLLT